MAEVERSIYFYAVEMAEGHEWRRADVLQGLADLQGEDQLVSLGNDSYAWARVDRVPTGGEAGRLRFFRERRSNLPGFVHEGEIGELPIAEEAGLIEPTHVVLAGDGLIAAEYNHLAPRIPSQFAALLRQKLGLNLTIGTYAQGDIIEQLDRLEEIQLLEFSLLATPELEEELRDAGAFGDAAASLSRVDHGKRLYLRLSGDKHSDSWGAEALAFAKRIFGMPSQEHVAKVLRVSGDSIASPDPKMRSEPDGLAPHC
jgi:hypothetical protein